MTNNNRLVVSAVFAVILITALVLSAKAQFRPCVWPNTCSN